MSLMMENAYQKIGCGDPGDPIEFSGLLDGDGYLQSGPMDDEFGGTIPYVLTGWFKPSVIDVRQPIITQRHISQTSAHTWFGLETANVFTLFKLNSDQSTVDVNLSWKGDRRDMAAPFHWHLLVEPDQPPSDRFTLTVGGVELEKQAGAVYSGALAAPHFFASPHPMRIGTRYLSGPSGYLRGYISKLHAVRGAKPAASEFGRFNAHGQWVNRTYDGPHGPLGFHLDFADEGDLGKDVSGNGNHFTVFGDVRQSVDTSTDNATNFLACGPVKFEELSEGAQTAVGTSSGLSTQLTNILIPTEGKWCGKFTLNSGASAQFGVMESSGSSLAADGYSYRSNNGELTAKSSVVGVAAKAIGPGDSVEVLIDVDAAKIAFRHAGSIIGSITGIDTNERLMFAIRDGDSSSPANVSLDFGQNGYLPPDDYKILSRSNIPCPVILDPSQYYQREQLIDGADLDLNWSPLVDDTIVFTGRTDSEHEYRVNMIIGGVQVNPFNTAGTGGEIVGEDGFTFNAGGAAVGAAIEYQGTRRDRAFRCTSKSGMALVLINHVNGTPTVVNHNAGGVAEEITFFPVNGGDRREYHKAIGGDAYRSLNGNGSNVAPDEGFISGNVVNQFIVNGSLPSRPYRLWIKRSVPQFSRAFSYEGNDNAPDGAFIPLDFEPNFVSGQNISDVGNYYIKDNLSVNPNTEFTEINDFSGHPGAGWEMDFYSNGFKWRSTRDTVNEAATYAGFAIAKTPIKFANAV